MTVEQLHEIFESNQLNYFTGVPDSTFKSWMSYLADNEDQLEHRIAVNEGAAIAHATGYHLSTGKVGVVYLQNSGLGNCINPLTSLADEKVYAIPMILLIGWRGEPGVKDEPQHAKMGEITLELLQTLGIPYFVLCKDSIEGDITQAKVMAVTESKPVALIVKSTLLDDYKKIRVPSKQELTREDAIEKIINGLGPNTVIVGTTGKTSRELFEMREKMGQDHKSDFYTVGSMGHANAIALEIALQKPEKYVFVIDGDGALLMHMGSMATIGHYAPSNLTHILIDNGCHESTGGQATVSKNLNFEQIAKACGYKTSEICSTIDDIDQAMSDLHNKPSLIVIKVKAGSRNDLGRPTQTPEQNKKAFMEGLAG